MISFVQVAGIGTEHYSAINHVRWDEEVVIQVDIFGVGGVIEVMSATIHQRIT